MKKSDITPDAVQDGEYRYRLYSTGDSSAKYGVCEVCGKHATEVFHQVEERAFYYPENGQTYMGWTQHLCHSFFGHETCLRGKRRHPHREHHREQASA